MYSASVQGWTVKMVPGLLPNQKQILVDIYIKTSVIYFLSSWKLENMTNTRNMKLFLLFIEMSSNCKFQKG